MNEVRTLKKTERQKTELFLRSSALTYLAFQNQIDAQFHEETVNSSPNSQVVQGASPRLFRSLFIATASSGMKLKSELKL